MSRPLFLAVLACAASLLACSPGASNDAGTVTTDVERFIAVQSRMQPNDTLCSGLAEYLDGGTAGLREYQRRFRVDEARLCRAMHQRPERYANLAEKLTQIDSMRDPIDTVLGRVTSMLPEVRWPTFTYPVYFVVGNGVSGGSAIRGRPGKILIGTELMSSPAGLPRLVAHEAVHTQQKHPGIRKLTGGPVFLRGTVLRHSVVEGAADFIAELATGDPPTAANFVYGAEHEATLWPEFERAMHGREYRMWLYNGWNREELGERPPDLGYFFGYRIVQAYYEQAENKHDALEAIISIRHFSRFLDDSGYRGGITPANRMIAR
jgi:hypothetical protein